MLSVHSDWLAQWSVASTIHLQSNGEKQNGLPFGFGFAFVAVLEINQILDRLIIQLVWYILKQLFTSVSMKFKSLFGLQPLS